MEILSAEDVERVYRVSDELRLHRDWVVVPINCSADGLELQMPDGKLLLRPPGGEKFKIWLEGLRRRLEDLDLNRVPRNHVDDPKHDLTGEGEPRLVGTRTYVDEDLAVFETRAPRKAAG
jgi:hypothetical protein